MPQFYAAKFNHVYVYFVPLRVSAGPLSDLRNCFGLTLTWQLLAGPQYQLDVSKTLSPGVVPLAAAAGFVYSIVNRL